MEELQKIRGIGPVLAEKLQAELHLDEKISNERLRYILRDEKIFHELPIAAKVDLLYCPLSEIPRDIIHVIRGELSKYARRIKFDIAGSYRRGKLVSHDVDIVLAKGELEKMIKLVNSGSQVLHICEPFAQGDDKASLLFEILVPIELRHLSYLKDRMSTTKKVRVKVDIFMFDAQDYIFTLLFATGSGTFNVRMRAIAKKRGYLLNQHGLFIRREDDTAGKQISVKNEKELFKILKIAYKTPEERNE